MTDVFSSDAPKPMAQFDKSFYQVDSHNQQLLQDEQARQTKIMNKRSLKASKQKLSEIQMILDEHQVDAMLAEYQTLVDEFEGLRKQYLKCQEQLVLKPNSPKILSDISILQENRKQLLEDVRVVKRRIHPYRKLIVKRDTIKGRIDEHINMVMDMKQADRDRKEMEKEANVFAQIIIRTWSRLGFQYERTRNKKVRRDTVRFEKIIATPDDLQFKIDVSKLGLFDGTIHNLPSGVRAFKLVEPDTLRELSSACEREVTSPNIDGLCDWSKGVWLRLYRHNYRGGLMEYVSYKHVMERYPHDNHSKFPLPMGVRAGRYINWVNLVDHPHWLFAGQTGSGKTNAIRVGLSAMVANHTPDEIRFILIDLKRNGDLNPYEKTPHCIGKVVKTVEDVAILIEQIEKLMYNRMEQISKITNDIVDYNKIVEPENRLPRIVIVFDEYGAIRAKGKDIAKQIEASAKLIATQSRASGIHMWLGIQQSYSDSIDKMIKGNVTIAFGGRQRTQGGAMSVSGNASAMKLAKIPGRMLCDDGNDSYQIQMPHLSKDDLNKSIASTAKWDKPRKLELPEIANQEILKMKEFEPLSHELIIQTAFDEFDGMVKARAIWEFLDRHDISLTKVLKLAKEIKMMESVEHNGQRYSVKKVGRSFQLVPHEITESIENTDDKELEVA